MSSQILSALAWTVSTNPFSSRLSKKILNQELLVAFIESYIEQLETAKQSKKQIFSVENTELIRKVLDAIATTKYIAFRRKISSSRVIRPQILRALL